MWKNELGYRVAHGVSNSPALNRFIDFYTHLRNNPESRFDYQSDSLLSDAPYLLILDICSRNVIPMVDDSSVPCYCWAAISLIAEHI